MIKEIEFLKELQQTLKTQETDYQAAPRFWAIKDYRVVPGNPKYDNCTTMYFHNDGDHTEFENVEDLKEFLEDFYWDDVYEYLEADEVNELRSWLEGETTVFEDLWSFTLGHLNDDGYFDECPVKEEEFICYNTMFLTKEDAKRHLKLNHYHYSKKAHTYAMTAWRSPKVEKLLDILETFDWDRVKVTEEVCND